MRTTLNIEEALLQRLKTTAAQSGRSLSEVVEEAVRAFLSPRHSSDRKVITLPVSKHDLRLRPGVNLDSNASLSEMMDEDRMEKMRATSRR